MNRTIKNILFGINKIPMVFLYYGVMFYFSYLLWYVIGNSSIFASMKCGYLGFAVLICFSISFIIGSSKLIADLFFNKKIADLIILPLSTLNIFRVILRKNVLNQLSSSIIVFFPCLLIFNLTWKEFVLKYTTFIVLTIAFNSFILIILILICKLSSWKNIGYHLIIFQYVCFIGYALFVKEVIYAIVLSKGSFIYDLWLFIILTNIKNLLLMSAITVLLVIFTMKLYEDSYLNAHYKIINFQKIRKKASSQSFIDIKNSYLFIEFKRFSRKKVIFFYSSVKSIITIVIVSKIFVNKVPVMNTNSSIINYMAIATLISSINIISTTSFSSDLDNINYFRILPIDFTKLFKVKVIVSFLVNEVLVIIYTIISALLRIEYIYYFPLLLLYSTVTNLLCAWLGVYLDYNAPSKANSDNELLHGNRNKLGVVIFGVSKLALELWISLKILTDINILLIATVDNLLFLIVIVILSYKLVRRNYDTN